MRSSLKILIIVFIGTIIYSDSIVNHTYSALNKGTIHIAPVVKPDSLPYLGQTPPDTIPLRFGPSYLLSDGIWWWHGSPKFSPDGKEMFFVKYHSNLPAGWPKIYVMRDVNGEWTPPASPSFASDSIDNSPVYSRDGNTLFFASTRSGSTRIYYVTRTLNDWSQPQMLNMAYQSMPGTMGWDFSFTIDSTIYFSLFHPVDGLDIYRSHPNNGIYSQFEKLPPQINTSYNDATPYIDPYERYIMFMSNRPGQLGNHDIYISFKKSDGSWTEAQNMGNQINGPNGDAFPSVTLDGKYMFFNSIKTGDLSYNAYWVDSKVIDRLNPIGIKRESEMIPKESELFQNYPNPFNPSTKIRFQINKTGKVALRIYDILGRESAVPVDSKLQPGTYEVTFDMSNLNNRNPAGGIYFYRLDTDNYSQTKKMIFLK